MYFREIFQYNLIIGENSTGKTFILKALYSAIRAMEEYKRGDDIRSMKDILSEKLRWTFQTDNLGDLVTRTSDDPLRLKLETDHPENNLEYQFSKNAKSQPGNIISPEEKKEGNSIFIPAKEVLSLFSVILKSREMDRSFGFDDTYYDLVKALQTAPTREKNCKALSQVRKALGEVIQGSVDYDETNARWFYRAANGIRCSIGVAAESIKKISMIDRLLANGHLNTESIIFIDEVESALHPSALCDFLDLIYSVSHEMDIQVFISTHSYFVVKQLFLIALLHPGEVTCISLKKDEMPEITDLSEGIPKNSIIQTSVDLYEQEIDAAFNY